MTSFTADDLFDGDEFTNNDGAAGQELYSPLEGFELLCSDDDVDNNSTQTEEAIVLDNCCMDRNITSHQDTTTAVVDSTIATCSNGITQVDDTDELFTMMDSLIGNSFANSVEQYCTQPFGSFTQLLNNDIDYSMVNRKNSWKVTVEQVDGKKGTYNFRTFLRITVALNGRYVAFKPTHLGFYKGNNVTRFNTATLPTEMSLSWERFGSNCYNNQSGMGNYFVVLNVQSSTNETVNLGVNLTVSRVNKPGNSNTLYYTFAKYTWFELDNVNSFVDTTNPQLPSLWSEKSLERECNSVYTSTSCPDSKVTQAQVASWREKGYGSSSNELSSEEKPRKKTKKH